MSNHVGQIARELRLARRKVAAVMELLERGNAAPFIARFRQTETGGLDEARVREIELRSRQLSALAERKRAILKLLQARQVLTHPLQTAIEAAATQKRLEELYAPWRTQRQSLADTARAQGWQPLAERILQAEAPQATLEQVAELFLAEQSASQPETSAPETSAPETSAPETSAPETSAPETSAPETSAPEASAPETSAPEASQPETSAPEASQPETSAPETSVPEASAPEASQPEASAPEASQPEASQPLPSQPEAGQPAPSVATAPASIAADPPAKALTINDALDGAARIIAEQLAGDCELRQALYRCLSQQGELAVSRLEAPKPAALVGGLSKREIQEYRDYFDYCQPLRSIPPHRALAVNRGERCKVLKVRVQCEMETLWKAGRASRSWDDHPFREYLEGCLRDALKRLLLPSLEREVRRELTERSERRAVRVFQQNLKSLLLQPPVRGRNLVALDPGLKSGCKAAALDQYGNVLELAEFSVLTEAQRTEAQQALAELMRRHQATLVAIGNGAGVRPTERLVSEMFAEQFADCPEAAYALVNEAGTSVYSTSAVAREELPDCSAVMRSAVSIGRRLLDPLAELVKIPPSSIGVGLYQHDIGSQKLRDSLDGVVESCVNHVGVDVNTASPALLRYVAGLNQLSARALYEQRLREGPFRTREELKQAAGFGESAFVQAAGFLRIHGGPCALDETWVHPENYGLAEKILQSWGDDVAALGLALTQRREGDLDRWNSLVHHAASADAAKLAENLNADRESVAQILDALRRAGEDPRDQMAPVLLRRSALSLEELQVGAELTGVVANVVDFGVFVDIGVGDNGLVHISELADQFVADPQQHFQVGDRLVVWVLQVDAKRRRVKLSAMGPNGRRGGAPHQDPARAPKRRARRRPTGAKARSSDNQRQVAPQGAASKPPQPRPQRPARPAAPPKPISPDMVEGKAPMRSFGDLLQYYDHKAKDESGDQ